MIKWLKRFYYKLSNVHERLDAHRDDINSNTSECSKLLYRLEECELQNKVLDERVKTLEKGG